LVFVTPGGWLVESVTISLFTFERLPSSAWRDLSGGREPAEATRSQTPGTDSAAGPFEGTWLWLHESYPPGRIQLALAPGPPEVSEGPWPFHVGDLALRLDQLRTLALRLNEQFEDVWRVGLGATLIHPVPGPADAMDWLSTSNFLPNVRLDRKTVDFLYRVNRPAELTTAGDLLRIHRLRAFSVVSIFPAGEPGGSAATACRLEIDINTVQNQTVDKAAYDYEEILKTFASWSLDIATRGDVGDVS
jgi:hypothetical protein